ncbi:YeiH family protein [Plasticicumulans acidivorans]|uniref:Putative integral membrane protein (TIGR00698 family) n=1 Tax=Plasticicumulans acidivorans TaxID=886464 RepID=A0A317MSF6_9GAMM|nr:putative sulfate exporter family transporter [Plasticicumulans acidivorans]PWV60153.1 putative integral membrane protein (TIGR00698 family) [Plasticicumulans acidivorans]
MTTAHAARRPRAAGLVLVAAVAAVAALLAARPAVQQAGLGALTLAILLGILAGNTVFPRLATHCASGVDFARGPLLRLGIVLFGLKVSFQQIAGLGWQVVAIDACVVAGIFTLGWWLGTRLFGLDRETAMLVGAGSAICGAAAVLATEPVLKAPAHKVAVAVATVVIFGTLAMFAWPLAYPHLGLDERAYGVLAGSTIHEVAQVVVAGRAIGEQAAADAVIVKMMRVMLLAPFLLLLSWRLAPAGERAQRVTIPWFAVLFIVASGVNSLGVLPAALKDGLLTLDTALLAMAMAALGLRTHAGALRQAGLRPLALAATLALILAGGGYLLNRVLL